jgi:hypothetical protein
MVEGRKGHLTGVVNRVHQRVGPAHHVACVRPKLPSILAPNEVQV